MGKTETFDVVIIGAGLSGLSAAFRLKSRLPELKIIVLEASEHVGGRTRTMRIKGPQGQDEAFDLGAHWVCDNQPEILELMKNFDIGYYPQNVKGTKILEVGDNKVRTYTSEIPNLGWIALIQMQLLINKAEDLCKQIDIRDPYASPFAHYLDSMTIATFVRQHCKYEDVFDIFNAAVQAVMGCDSAQISALFFLAYANAAGGMMNLLLVENGAAQQYRVKGGTQQISHQLHQAVGDKSVRFNSPVKAVEENGDFVEVKCLDGTTYTAKRVICTTPTNQTAKIDFTPPISSARQTLFKNFYLGNLAKVFVTYDESFWLKDGFSGEVVSTGGPSNTDGCETGPVTVWYDATTFNGTPALVGLLGGKNVDQWFAKTVNDRKAAIIKQLVTYYGPKAQKPANYFEKNWNEEKYVSGAPAVFCPPGSMYNFHLLRTPHGKVHFGGTEMATKWCGYMSGAVQAGYHAAAEVIRELHPSQLTPDDKSILAEFKPKQSREYRHVKRQQLGSDFMKIYVAVGIGLAILAYFKLDTLAALFRKIF